MADDETSSTLIAVDVSQRALPSPFLSWHNVCPEIQGRAYEPLQNEVTLDLQARNKGVIQLDSLLRAELSADKAEAQRCNQSFQEPTTNAPSIRTPSMSRCRSKAKPPRTPTATALCRATSVSSQQQAQRPLFASQNPPRTRAMASRTGSIRETVLGWPPVDPDGKPRAKHACSNLDEAFEGAGTQSKSELALC
ncbi:hypothetical protein G7046_g1448 [Stylonectria norvegica]|nr:hypothetical protein G7046_g1448 [Stylonectria norvegica]